MVRISVSVKGKDCEIEKTQEIAKKETGGDEDEEAFRCLVSVSGMSWEFTVRNNIQSIWLRDIGGRNRR
jgi:hypothetical protein